MLQRSALQSCKDLCRAVAKICSGAPQVTALFEPTASRSLNNRTETKDYVVLNILEDVRTTLEFWRFEAGVWTKQEVGFHHFAV